MYKYIETHNIHIMIAHKCINSCTRMDYHIFELKVILFYIGVVSILFRGLILHAEFISLVNYYNDNV